MTWYASSADSKGESELKQFLSSSPSLSQIFELPNYLDQLRNTRTHELHDYLYKNLEFTRELANLISLAPTEADSFERKHKYPCLALETLVIEGAILKNFLMRANPAPLVQAFQNILAAQDPLPLLCGYFHTLNQEMHSKIPLDCVDLIYENSQLLLQLTRHSQSRALMQVLAFYLNLQETVFKSQVNRERLPIKLEIVRVLLENMKGAVESGREEEEIRVENICSVLMEITGHYHLIVDGRALLDAITSEAVVNLLWDVFMRGDGFSLAIAPLLREVMVYYVHSSFNTEDTTNSELARRNQQRLDSLPFIRRTVDLLPVFLQQTTSSPTLSIWHLKGVEIFSLAISLSSRRVADTFKSTNYFLVLINLLTKHDQLSIFHTQVVKFFQTVFAVAGQPDRRILQEHRKWMFIEGGLMDATMGALVRKYGNIRESSMPKDNSFPFMLKIITVYFQLSTADEQVSNFIAAQSALWSDFTNNIRKPYDAFIPPVDKQGFLLGKVPSSAPVLYTTTKNFAEDGRLNQMGKSAFFEEINREKHMQTFISPPIDKPTEEAMFPISKFDDMMVTTSMDLQEKQAQQSSQPQIMAPINPVLVEPITAPPLQEEPAKNVAVPTTTTTTTPATSSYQEFLSKQKVEVDAGLKIQRSNSAERRLSANKSRVTSPSPKKKKWDDTGSAEEDKTAPKLTAAPKQPDVEAKKQKISLTTQSARPNIPTSRIPPIPHHHVNTSINSNPPPAAEPKQTKSEPPETTQSAPVIPTQPQAVSPQPPVIPTLAIQSLPSPRSRSPQRVTTDEASPRMAISKSTYELSSPVLPQDIERLTKSDMNLKELKNIRFRKERVLRPQKSEYRKVEKRDELLLDFLGVQY